jgi:hypothetical protein
MSDTQYLFVVPFWSLLAIMVVGFIFQMPILVGLAAPLLVIVIAVKL